MSAATALSNACDAANITEGLEPIKMLNQEVSNRWQVMTAVVEHKKNEIDSVQQQLKLYEDTADKVEHMLNRAESTLDSHNASGADVNKARANKDTIQVTRSVCVNFIDNNFFVAALLRMLLLRNYY